MAYINGKRLEKPFNEKNLKTFTIEELLRIASLKKVSIKKALIDLLISTNKATK